jgi:hypothetical protein
LDLGSGIFKGHAERVVGENQNQMSLTLNLPAPDMAGHAMLSAGKATSAPPFDRVTLEVTEHNLGFLKQHYCF